MFQVHYGRAPEHAAGGVCYFCGQCPEGIWINSDKFIDWEGKIAVCGQCGKEIAALVEFVSPQAVARMKGDIKKLKVELDEKSPKAAAYDLFIAKIDEITSGSEEVTIKEAEANAAA